MSYRESTRQQKKLVEPSSATSSGMLIIPKVETSNTYEALSAGKKSGISMVNAVVAKKEKEAPVLDDWESFEG